jgi:hypothetical protein
VGCGEAVFGRHTLIVPTLCMGAINLLLMIVPTLCVGMQPVSGVTTRSVGAITSSVDSLHGIHPIHQPLNP